MATRLFRRAGVLLLPVLLSLGACADIYETEGLPLPGSIDSTYHDVTPAYGDLRRTVQYPMEDVVGAATRALNQMSMLGVDGTHSGLSGVVTGMTPDGERIVVQLRRLSAYRTDYGVSVSGMSDPNLVGTINARIQTELERAATQPRVINRDSPSAGDSDAGTQAQPVPTLRPNDR